LWFDTDFCQLETVQSSLQVDPDNTELQSLKAELEELINLTETSIAELKPAAPAKPAPVGRPKGPSRDEYASNNKSNFRSPTVEQSEESPAPTPASFSVNEHVLARWTSGDNSFYPARITSITGSSSNPVYIVSFKSYGTVESLTAKDLKPISNSDSRKRKADGSPGSSSTHSPVPQPPHASVISAAADINPALATQARKEPSKATDGPARPTKAARKVKANKELEEGKNKWKDFANKSKYGKKKESMFRTGEGVNARGMLPVLPISHHSNSSKVGFTGSGQQMRKDPTRTRHVYQQGEEDVY
jgi:survival-of-motor-neuron-related-splicing factor 30